MTEGYRTGFTSITPYWLNKRRSPWMTILRFCRFLKLSHVPRSDSVYASIAAAAFRVGPIPDPVSRYQAPLIALGSIPASFQSRNSALLVPLSSPRATNGACVSAILCSAATMLLPPSTRARSLAGPTRMKSLYITSRRSMPKPCSTKASSAALSWTKTTSQSPRSPILSACPVPTATTRTSMPVCLVKAGSRNPNSPDSSVEVVEATVMNGCSATAGDAADTNSQPMATTRSNHVTLPPASQLCRRNVQSH